MRTLEEMVPKGISNEEFVFSCTLDPAYFAEHVLGLEIQDFHKEWFKLIQEHQRVCIIAPRESGKTTMLGVVYPLWIVMFQHNKQVMIVSSSLDNATKVLEQVKTTLMDNEMLQTLIPAFKQLAWTKTEINTSTHCKIYCKPYGQNIRGAHVNYILLDEASLFRDKKVFFDVITPTVQIKKGKIVLIGTPQHEADLLMDIKNNEGYIHKIYRSVKEDGTPLWPGHFDQKILDRIKSEIGESAFAKEYLCDPSTSADLVFSPTKVARCLDQHMRFDWTPTENIYMGVDLGISITASWSVITVVDKRIDEDRYIIKFLDRMKGISPDAQATRIGEYAKMFNAKQVLIDQSGFGISVINDLRKDGIRAVGQEFDSRKRMDLLQTLATLFEGEKIRLPYSLDDGTARGLVDNLIKELFGFTIDTTTFGLPVYRSHTKNDDMVMSLALACKAAYQQKKFLDYFGISNK